MLSMHKPNSTNPLEWHLYIRSARNFATAQDRMEQAVAAGVDFAAMLALQ